MAAEKNEVTLGKKHVIIDCDPSADDALALMLAVSSPELSVEAVTAVSGVCHVSQSAKNALDILALCGRMDIPVAAGAGAPLKRAMVFDGKYCGSDGLSENHLKPSPVPLSEKNAVELMYECIQAHPGEISIISIAPMTNLAELFLKYPEIKDQICRIYTINGSYGVAPDKSRWNPRPSWNVAADPEAAKIVLESGVPVTAAGLDVTMQLDNSMAERLLAEGRPETSTMEFFRHAVAFNRRKGLEPYSLLVDSMAVAAAAKPELADCVKGKTAVCDQDGLMCGQTLFGVRGYLDSSASEIEAAYAFDFTTYINMFLERVFS